MTVEDIQKSIKASLYERVSSPLIGTFIFSWCLINWRVLGYIFFNVDPNSKKTKIELIENYINNESFSVWVSPIISTITIITILPFFSLLALWISESFKSKKIKIKLNAEDNTPLSIEESLKLRIKIRDLQKEFHEVNLKKEEEINSLSDTIRTIQAENKDILSSQSNLKDAIESRKSEISRLTHLCNKRHLLIQHNGVQINKNYQEYKRKFKSKYDNLSIENQQKLLAIIKSHNNDSHPVDHFRQGNEQVNYLITQDLIIYKNDRYELTDFGIYVSLLELDHMIPRRYLFKKEKSN